MFRDVLGVFRGVPGCSGVFRGVPRLFRVLQTPSTFPYFLSAFVTSLSALSQNKAQFWLFYLFYNIALLTFVKKLAFNCRKSIFFHSLQARARKVACQRAQNGVTGYSVHLYSDKARCFNQSECALYRNFIITHYIIHLCIFPNLHLFMKM